MNKSTILSGEKLSKKYGDLEVVKGRFHLRRCRRICLPGREIRLRQDDPSFSPLRSGTSHQRER